MKNRKKGFSLVELLIVSRNGRIDSDNNTGGVECHQEIQGDTGTQN
jgi:hypothetical protein